MKLILAPRHLENVEELTITYKEGDIETVKELDKIILTKGAWSTIMYKFQDWNNTKQEYGPVKYSIRRYQKRNGAYALKSKFNISNNDKKWASMTKMKMWELSETRL